MLTVVVLAGGVAAWRAGLLSGRHTGRDAGLPWQPPIGTPTDLLVPFPLDRQPVAGWQVGPTDVGLPDYAPLGELFAASGDKAYFLSQFVDNFCTTACRPQQAWVYGIDTRTGARLFDPVPLPDYSYDAECFGNGPGVAVCLKTGARLTAWVIDLVHGSLSFTGPTDVGFAALPGRPEAHPAGTHLGQTWLVAAVEGQGVFGVGSHGERTWSVPGDGFFTPMDYRVANDIPAPTLAVSTGGDPNRVFSVTDGADLTPTAPAGLTLHRAVVYNEGFAYAYRNSQSGETGVLFYDAKGRLVAQRPLGRSTVTLLDNPPMPAVEVDGNIAVYTAAGTPVTQFAAPKPVTDVRTIGAKIYLGLGEPSERRWQQWDLLTGQAGATCSGVDLHGTFPDGTYVASDGTTIVGGIGLHGERYAAVNMTSCQTMWQTPDDAHVAIWKVGTGLLQRDRDRNTMTWLRPPG
ncbi:hypothetical protein [Mycobacterium asiaticum]|uniref:Pyrrolo-quinoline quinone n=1 Tax=Mycobacterium asiaticum TaxID=1790 RepID=A0A1A3MZZ8_MYCAS|nr:hypothetical protein [Mycobacterium asiaticum]OBK15106.1 hypothetical protein A5635_00430 [Mycobacterium asiaticum]